MMHEAIVKQQQPSLYIRCASCGDILRVMRGDLPSSSAPPVVLIEPCESCVAAHRLECYRIGLGERREWLGNPMEVVDAFSCNK